MKTFFYKSIPIFAVLFFVLGCSLFNRVKNEIDKTQPPKVVTSPDGKTQLTVPGAWEERSDLNEEANLQAGNPVAEQYAIVISESREDFTADMTLENFAKLTQENAKTVIKDGVVSEPTSLTINGYPVKQFEISGSMQNINAKWIYAIVETPKNYHQIMAWTLASRYEQNKPVLLEVINSFKETETNAPPAGNLQSSNH